MSNRITFTLALSLLASPALAQQIEPTPRPNPPQREAEGPVGKTAPQQLEYVGVAGNPHALALRGTIQVIHVFDLKIDDEAAWYEVEPGSEGATRTTLEHLQRLAPEYAKRFTEDETDEVPRVTVYGLAVVGLGEPVYGAAPVEPPAPGTDDPAREARDRRKEQLKRIQLDALVTFALLDAGEDHRFPRALGIEQSMVLVIDTEGVVRFAAREGALTSPDGQTDYVAQALDALLADGPVPNPHGRDTPPLQLGEESDAEDE